MGREREEPGELGRSVSRGPSVMWGVLQLGRSFCDIRVRVTNVYSPMSISLEACPWVRWPSSGPQRRLTAEGCPPAAVLGEDSPCVSQQPQGPPQSTLGAARNFFTRVLRAVL